MVNRVRYFSYVEVIHVALVGINLDSDLSLPEYPPTSSEFTVARTKKYILQSHRGNILKLFQCFLNSILARGPFLECKICLNYQDGTLFPKTCFFQIMHKNEWIRVWKSPRSFAGRYFHNLILILSRKQFQKTPGKCRTS